MFANLVVFCVVCQAIPDRELELGQPFFDELRARGVRVLLPRVDRDDEMRFVFVGAGQPLVPHDKMRLLLQPDESAPEELPDVVVCPGRAFDVAG